MVSRKRTILVSCGAGAATSTAVAVRIRELLINNHINAEIVTCMASEIQSLVEARKPDLIVATVQKPPDIKIPYFNGIPYLTNIGADELDRKIIALISKD